MPIDAALLRAQFLYDARTGIFTRRISTSNRVKAGAVAGFRLRGYVFFSVEGRRQPAHRMAWLYVFGEMPVGEVDHRDGVGWHNWIDNLRDETTVVNQHNQTRAHRQSKTGILGVSPYRDGGFVAQIKANGRAHWLGRFDTPEAAGTAYVEAKRRLHSGSTL